MRRDRIRFMAGGLALAAAWIATMLYIAGEIANG